MSSKRLKRVLAAVALLIPLLVSVPPAAAINCGADTWFDGDGWRDNPKIKSGCDTVGTHVHVVQHFDFGAGYSSGGLDGIWGPDTAGGIEDFKEFVCGFSNPSGNVGSNAWECYRDELIWNNANNNFTDYNIPGMAFNAWPQDEMMYKHHSVTPKRWYAKLRCNFTTTTWEKADVFHFPNCQ